MIVPHADHRAVDILFDDGRIGRNGSRSGSRYLCGTISEDQTRAEDHECSCASTYTTKLMLAEKAIHTLLGSSAAANHQNNWTPPFASLTVREALQRGGCAQVAQIVMKREILSVYLRAFRIGVIRCQVK